MSGFNAAVGLSRLIGDAGLTLYRFQYDYLAFESWLVEGGTSHWRVQLLHDGKDNVLRLSLAASSGRAQWPAWTERQVIHLEPRTAAEAMESKGRTLLEEAIREFRAR